MLCDKTGSDKEGCGSIATAIELLPPKSCEQALREPEYIQTRVLEQKATCTELMDKLCADLGAESGACAMVRDQAPKFDGKRCRVMLDQYGDVLADLRQMDLDSKPLSPEDQQAIAATDAPAFGPGDAKVTLVLFSDFECPYCVKAAAVAQHVKANFSTQVRFVFRQFPLSFHKHARLAAEAALLAHGSGKFWEYHDQLFANQENLELDSLTSYGKSVGLDPATMREKLNGHAYEAKVKADVALGERVHVRGTPTLFINGKRSQNPTSVEVVANEVAAALAE
jgi:protein-disulfide isomerase